MLSDLWISVLDPCQLEGDYSDASLILPYRDFDKFISVAGSCRALYVSLPYVIRDKDIKGLNAFFSNIGEKNINGLIANNIDGIVLAREYCPGLEVITGPGVYAWNSNARDTLLESADGFIYPYELSKYELRDIKSPLGMLTVYGRTPLMISANCIRKTENRCKKGEGERFGFLGDRKGMKQVVYFDCSTCTNVIYNALPTSLHEYIGKDIDVKDRMLLSFTNESGPLAHSIYEYFLGIDDRSGCSFPVKEFTKAYFNHGVE